MNPFFRMPSVVFWALLLTCHSLMAAEMGKPSDLTLTIEGANNTSITTTATVTISQVDLFLGDAKEGLLLMCVTYIYKNTDNKAVHRLDYTSAAIKADDGFVLRGRFSGTYEMRANKSAPQVYGIAEDITLNTDAADGANAKNFNDCKSGESYTNRVEFYLPINKMSGNLHFGFVSPVNEDTIQGLTLIFNKAQSTFTNFKPSKYVRDDTVLNFWSDVVTGHTSAMRDKNIKTFFSPVWEK